MLNYHAALYGYGWFGPDSSETMSSHRKRESSYIQEQLEGRLTNTLVSRLGGKQTRSKV